LLRKPVRRKPLSPEFRERHSNDKQRPHGPPLSVPAPIPLLVSVSLDVMLGSFAGVMRRMRLVSLGYMRVVGSCFVISVFVMLGSLSMVVGRKLMMLGSLGVMMRRFLRHSVSFRLSGSGQRTFGSAEHCPQPEFQSDCWAMKC
jgi:hypothetical protein